MKKLLFLLSKLKDARGEWIWFTEFSSSTEGDKPENPIDDSLVGYGLNKGMRSFPLEEYDSTIKEDAEECELNYFQLLAFLALCAIIPLLIIGAVFSIAEL